MLTQVTRLRVFLFLFFWVGPGEVGEGFFGAFEVKKYERKLDLIFKTILFG